MHARLWERTKPSLPHTLTPSAQSLPVAYGLRVQPGSIPADTPDEGVVRWRSRRAVIDQRKIPVHCDRVLLDGEDRIVIAARALPDWQATHFRRTAVIFRNVRYYAAEVLAKDPGRPAPKHDRGFRYRLSPWPDSLNDRPARTIIYNSAGVEQREREYRSVSQGALESFSLIALCAPAYPLLGLLPSFIKAWLEDRFHILALTTTRWSLRLVYTVGLIAIVASFANLIAPFPIHPGPAWLAPITSLGCLADFFARWDRVNERCRLQYGFLEWTVHRL